MHSFKDHRLRVPPTSAVSASAMLLLIAERQAVYYNVTLWRARKMLVKLPPRLSLQPDRTNWKRGRLWRCNVVGNNTTYPGLEMPCIFAQS